MEYVSTGGLAVGHLREVEREERSSRTSAHATGPRESAACTSSAVDARTTTGVPGVMGRMDRREIRDVVEHERTLEVDRPLERDLGHLAPGGAEPALAHQKRERLAGLGREDLDPGRRELAQLRPACR